MTKITIGQQGKTESFLRPARGMLQRTCACGNHRAAGEECAQCAKNKSGLHGKRIIGASNDSLEREADQIADEAMTAPAHSAVSGVFPNIQRLTGQPTGQAHVVASTSVDQVLASPGRPLGSAIKQDMERRFGHDFTRVRVHSDTTAEQSAKEVRAKAYTVGHSIVFGAGQFAPATQEGRRLIAHELAHVVQQQGGVNLPIIQRKDSSLNLDPQKDAETILGERLLKEFPNGVAVAIFADPEPTNAKLEAEEWAKRENAIGTKVKTLTAKSLMFGQAISENLAPLSDIVNTLSKVLLTSIARASTTGTIVQPGGGPASIRSLALFSHGEPYWMGIGKKQPIFLTATPKLIKKIAPSLASNVNVMLYACGVGRGQKEPETWVKGTMEGGGSDSLAGVMRDALLEEGKESATVWGHTTTGNVTNNPALREFTAASGKNAPGVSYASTYIFTNLERNAAITELKKITVDKGYGLGDSDKFEQATNRELTKEMYRSYIEANKKITFQKGSLAQTAPAHPKEVAEIAKKYWEEIYWHGHKDKIVDHVIKDLKLQKAPRGRYRDYIQED